MGKSTPSPPDPVQVAQAQSSANVQSVLQSALVNQIGQRTPYGSVSFTGDMPRVDPQTGELRTTKTIVDPVTGNPIDVPLNPREQVVTLSPQAQTQFDFYNQIAANLLQRGVRGAREVDSLGKFDVSGAPQQVSSLGLSAPRLQQDIGSVPGILTEFGGPQGVPVERLDLTRLAQLPGVGDFSGDAQRQEQAAYQRALGLINPEFDRQERALDTRLATQGLPTGGEAYIRARDQFSRNRNEAVLNAALDSVGAGRQEQSRLFGLGLQSRQQGLGEATTAGQFANQAAAQAFDQALTRGQFANQGSAMAFDRQSALQQLRNQEFGLGMDLASRDATLANQARQQAIADQLTQRSVPINEVAALMQGTPALPMPQLSSPAQFQVAPTDVIGPTFAAFNARNRNANAGLAGLLGLGSSIFGLGGRFPF